jgi:hypothetical protein
MEMLSWNGLNSFGIEDEVIVFCPKSDLFMGKIDFGLNMSCSAPSALFYATLRKKITAA